MYGKIFEMPEEDEENPDLVEYSETGYESQFFIKNAGSLLIFILLQAILIIIVAVSTPCPAICDCCKRPYLRLKNWVIFSPVLRLLLEATLDFSFSIFIQRVTITESGDE